MRAEWGLVDVLRNWKQCTCKLCQSPTRTQNAANATHPTRRLCVLWYTSPLPHMKILGDTWRPGTNTKSSRSASQAAALTGFAWMVTVFSESTMGVCREARKKQKCCKYPKQNFCNGCREGTKQLFLVWALWADHTRVIKQASYWVASIPASCLQARPLCSSATATAGPLPAAGRARLPFRALHSHFSLLSSLPE